MKTNRNRAIKVASAVVLLCLLLLLIRLTGILNFYRLPGNVMAPNYPKGSLVFSSRILSPSLNDAVVYQDSSLAVPGYRKPAFETFIGRLVAKEGDVLEIRDGHTFINGQRTDEGLRSYVGWVISSEDYYRNKALFKDFKPDRIQMMGGGQVRLCLEDAQAEQIRQAIPAMERYDPLINAYGLGYNWGEAGSAWTMHNFGPLNIPPGQVFIFDDNRADSEDSRQRGLVPAKDVIAKVLN